MREALLMERDEFLGWVVRPAEEPAPLAEARAAVFAAQVYEPIEDET